MPKAWLKGLGLAVAASALTVFGTGVQAKLQGQSISWGTLGTAVGSAAVAAVFSYLHPSPLQQKANDPTQ